LRCIARSSPSPSPAERRLSSKSRVDGQRVDPGRVGGVSFRASGVACRSWAGRAHFGVAVAYLAPGCPAVVPTAWSALLVSPLVSPQGHVFGGVCLVPRTRSVKLAVPAVEQAALAVEQVAHPRLAHCAMAPTCATVAHGAAGDTVAPMRARAVWHSAEALRVGVESAWPAGRANVRGPPTG
jgi:hypothetical protein